MRLSRPLVFAALFGLFVSRLAADDVDTIKNAVQIGTLNQPGTEPFHLKAVLAPSFERDRNSGRTGEVEIWWSSPTQWKREVRCPEFHQIDIVNADREWQKNEGDYFPEWLRNIAVELIEPIPRLDQVLERVKSAEQVQIQGRKDFSWMTMASNGTVQKGIGAGVTITQKTGLLDFGSGFGWHGDFHNYKDFHGRKVARIVNAGSPQVTAKVTVLEDLGQVPPDFFDVKGNGGDTSLIKTAVVNEPELRKNLITPDTVDWPPLKDGPLEGLLTAEIVVDRMGNVRDVGSVLSDNPGLSETASKAIWGLRFKPYLVDGQPVQAISTITMSFKTVRPAGMETFDSARNYFERSRTIGFPASSEKTAPYVLRALFQIRVQAGNIETGLYVDTFKSTTEWRREATIGKSRYVRSQQGEKRYELAEGPDVPLLRRLLEFIEPIPALDTFHEADWRIRRDPVASTNAIRVAAGYESPDGTPDPEQFRGYWFEENGNLVKTYDRGIETRPSDFLEYAGFHVPRDIRVLHNNGLMMLIHVNEISPAGELPDDSFVLKGHEWKRAFTAEVR